ncbi:unnamed protein product [Bursaphelenchus okinawaensis]|uniref:Uncharacterized protein n=1 Tax=Bursaphelenchus okinawaensis TaxID=465554 RepID=A0A811LRS2_9BILA|nr:unnamed protein product [Bursaphelenchus okinawaensis]CAG9128459.1 unnamed protein product [Bursaphelenchus okinawaensis]
MRRAPKRVVRFDRVQRVRHFSDDGLEPEEYIMKGKRKRMRLLVPMPEGCYASPSTSKKFKLSSILRSSPPPEDEKTEVQKFVESVIDNMKEKFGDDWHCKDPEFSLRVSLCAEEVLSKNDGKFVNIQKIFEDEFDIEDIDEETVADEEFLALKQLHLSAQMGLAF